MSVPHLDTRVVDGKTSLLFGPFAGLNPKFLKYRLTLKNLMFLMNHLFLMNQKFHLLR